MTFAAISQAAAAGRPTSLPGVAHQQRASFGSRELGPLGPRGAREPHRTGRLAARPAQRPVPQPRLAAGQAGLRCRQLPAAPLLLALAGTEAKARLTKRVQIRALMPGSLCRCRSHVTTGIAPGHFTSKQSSACGSDRTRVLCKARPGKRQGRGVLGDFALPAQAGGSPQRAWPGAAACSGGSTALGTGSAADVSGGSAPKSSVCVPEAQLNSSLLF